MNDNEKVLIEKLEELNNEYLQNEYYSLGKYIKTIIMMLKKRRFIKIFELLILHIKKDKNNKKIIKEHKKSHKYVIDNDLNDKVVVYTCITGSYDNIEEPMLTEKNCDYILFTNNKEIKSDVWKVKNIPEEISKLGNNAKINRYIKMHPNELFDKDYDYSIYIDGNVKLISIISDYIHEINKNIGLAIHKHGGNNCVYKESKICRAYGKGNYFKMKKQLKRYKKEGFPKEYGMLECNMLITDLKNEKSKEIFNKWWEEYLNSESMRDQIALPYILWKNNITIEEIGTLGDNINKNKKIKINMHI